MLSPLALPLSAAEAATESAAATVPVEGLARAEGEFEEEAEDVAGAAGAAGAETAGDIAAGEDTEADAEEETAEAAVEGAAGGEAVSATTAAIEAEGEPALDGSVTVPERSATAGTVSPSVDLFGGGREGSFDDGGDKDCGFEVELDHKWAADGLEGVCCDELMLNHTETGRRKRKKMSK